MQPIYKWLEFINIHRYVLDLRWVFGEGHFIRNLLIFMNVSWIKSTESKEKNWLITINASSSYPYVYEKSMYHV